MCLKQKNACQNKPQKPLSNAEAKMFFYFLKKLKKQKNKIIFKKIMKKSKKIEKNLKKFEI